MRIGHLFALWGLVVGCAANESAPTDAGAPIDPAALTITLGDALKGIEGKGPLKAALTTDQGVIEVLLLEKEAPKTVANFVALARGLRPAKDVESGEWVKRPFYDGLTFHRVIPGFMIQSGCPHGDGRGGPGYVFDDELSDGLRHDNAGIVAMVNAGPHTNGSQFYITDAPAPHLDGRNTIFGRVVKGLEVVQKIARAPRDKDDRPQKPTKLVSVRFKRG
ncbi:MAG: peptidylprolyl isomerase [Myxococcota bacterium]